MFKELTNFGYDRDWKEAIGFYLTYFLLVMILAIFLAILVVFASLPADAPEEASAAIAFQVGLIVAAVSCPVMCLLVLNAKNSLNKIQYILLALLSGILAFFVGALGGLIPAAFLTTRAKQD